MPDLDFGEDAFLFYPIYGGVKVSTGIVRYGKRVVALDHYKTDNFSKINDNSKVALAA